MADTATAKKKVAKKAPAKKKVAKKAVNPKTSKDAQAGKTAPKNSDDFAVIETGGKQYTVSVGDVLKIEKITGDHQEGGTVKFENVLLVDDGKDTTIGDPYIKGATVTATIEKIGRARKVDVVQYKAKSRHFKRKGHRQPFFQVKVTEIK